MKGWHIPNLPLETDDLMHAHIQLMTGIIFIKNRQPRVKTRLYNGLHLFSEVKIFHSCCYVCYQSSVSLGM